MASTETRKLPKQCQGGDDKARIGLALGPFSLADDAPDAAPTVQGGPAEVLEAASGLGGLLACGPRGGHLNRNFGRQSRVARQAEDVVYAVGLAPRHQFLAAEAAVGAQQDPRPWPAAADLADNAGH